MPSLHEKIFGPERIDEEPKKKVRWLFKINITKLVELIKRRMR